MTISCYLNKCQLVVTTLAIVSVNFRLGAPRCIGYLYTITNKYETSKLRIKRSKEVARKWTACSRTRLIFLDVSYNFSNYSLHTRANGINFFIQPIRVQISNDYTLGTGELIDKSVPEF